MTIPLEPPTTPGPAPTQEPFPEPEPFPSSDEPPGRIELPPTGVPIPGIPVETPVS